MDKTILNFLNRKSKNVEKKLKFFNNIRIFFDKDVDGLMSFLIVYSVLKKMKKRVEYIPTEVYELENFLSQQKDQNYLYIFLDLSLDKKFVEIIRKQKLKNIWIDHHRLKLFSSKDVFLINPTLVSPNSYIPTSALSYILFDRIFHLEESILFASIGIVADKGEEECKNILDRTFQKFRLSISDLKEIVGRLNSLFILNMSIEKILSRLNKKNFILNGEYLSKLHKKTEKIIEKEISNAIKNYNSFYDFILYKIKNRKYNLRSTVANILSEMDEFKDKVIIVYEERGDKILVSLRNGKNSNVNLVKLLKNLDINFKSFGGHKSAGGAIFLKKDLKKFLKNLKEYGRDR